MIPVVDWALSVGMRALSWVWDKVKIGQSDQGEHRQLLSEVVADASLTLSKPYDQPPDAGSPLRQVPIIFIESPEIVEAWRNLEHDWFDPTWREERFIILIRAMAKAVGKDLGDLTDRTLIHPFEHPHTAEGRNTASNRRQFSIRAAPRSLTVPEPQSQRNFPRRNGRRSRISDPRQSRLFDN